MSFKEVDDELWRRIRNPRADLRNTFNGILYVLYTGCRWVEVPYKVWSIRKLQFFDTPNTFKIFDFYAAKNLWFFACSVFEG